MLLWHCPLYLGQPGPGQALDGVRLPTLVCRWTHPLFLFGLARTREASLVWAKWHAEPSGTAHCDHIQAHLCGCDPATPHMLCIPAAIVTLCICAAYRTPLPHTYHLKPLPHSQQVTPDTIASHLRPNHAASHLTPNTLPQTSAHRRSAYPLAWCYKMALPLVGDTLLVTLNVHAVISCLSRNTLLGFSTQYPTCRAWTIWMLVGVRFQVLCRRFWFSH